MAGEVAAEVGGHYWTPADSQDPWNGVTTVYQSKADGSAQGQITVDCGYALAEVLTHTIVVHDSAGTKIACGTIGAEAAGGDDDVSSAVSVLVARTCMPSYTLWLHGAHHVRCVVLLSVQDDDDDDDTASTEAADDASTEAAADVSLAAGEWMCKVSLPFHS